MVLYSQFFRGFVVRKKQDLVQAKFHSLSDLFLPKESLIQFVPGNTEQYGPSNEEPLIGTYPGKVNVFFDDRYSVDIGNVRTVPFNNREAIKAYRKGHYKYTWARTLPTFAARRMELLVNNVSLGSHHVHYRTSRFVFFEKAYNQLATLIDAVNARAEDVDRNQFFVLPLPQGIPNYSNMLAALKNYKTCFKDGVYTTMNNQALLPFVGYGAYWLIDWIFFLNGDSEYSQFSKLTPKALDKLHIVFTANGKSWILKLGLIKSWLDELNDKDGKPKSTRLNVTKRILLVMKTLIDDIDPSTIKEATDVRTETKTTDQLGRGMDRVEEEDEEAFGGPAEGSSSDAVDEKADSRSNSLSDLYLESKDTHHGSNETSDGSSIGGTTGVLPVANNDGDASVEEDQETLDWTSPVEDALLENENSTQVLTDKKNIFNKPEDGVERALNARAKTGNLTVAEQAFFRKQALSYKSIVMENGETLDKFVVIDETKLRNIDSVIAPEISTISDKSMLESTVTQLQRNYHTQFLERDIASMFLGVQNAGMALTQLKKENVKNLQTDFDVYSFNFHDVDGSPSPRKIRLPKVSNDGTYLIDGVKQQLQVQRMEIPIRKINSRQVVLTSYYDRGLMVSRSDRVEYDYARWLKKQITLLVESGELKTTLGYSFDPSIPAPRTYSMIAQRYAAIKTKNHDFIFDLTKFADTKAGIIKLTRDGNIPIGKKGDSYYLLDEYGNVSLDGKMLGTIESLLGIDTTKAPIEITTMNVGGYAFPMGVVLSFYFGIDKLLEVIKAQYRTVMAGDRLNLSDDEYAVTFSDESLVFNRRDRFTTLIMGGLMKLPNISEFSRFDLNSPGVWVPIMANPRVKPRQFDEMRLIFDLFVDPITRDELIKRGYPTDMHYLLLEAVKMLTNDNTAHEIAITEQRFVGYERFAGKVYAELVRSTRQYRNKGKDRRHTFDINPEAVMMRIIQDASVAQVEEVNPIHEIKEQEGYTFGGEGGRSETTMVRRTRGHQEDYKGVVSEAGKDSGKVGYVGYLTSNAKVADYRGNINIDLPDTDTGLLSVVGNLNVGTTRDDPKRSLYASVQQSQAVAALNYQSNYLRTGYETVIAHRTSELYSKPAKQDGNVIKITKHGLVMEYKDGSKDTYPLGLKIGKAAGELHRHHRVTDLKVGDTFNKGDIVGWDEMYFERDFIDPRQVSWKAGVMTRIAMHETQFTFEDSVEVTSEFAEQTKTPLIKATNFKMDFKEGINLNVKVGDHVDYDAILCTIIPEHLVGVQEQGDFIGLSETFGLKQVKANHHGKIIKIEVTYNGNVEEMSDTLKYLVNGQNKELKAIDDLLGTGVTDANLAGNTSFAKAAVLPGRVNIDIIIEELNETETADKFVAGNQMKGTVGNIVNKIIRTLDGRKVQLIFSFKGLFNRMVLSLRDKMAVCETALGMSIMAAKAYRGKK